LIFFLLEVEVEVEVEIEVEEKKLTFLFPELKKQNKNN